MPKFTFKTEKPTGKWRSFDNDSHYIKLDGKVVGNIDHEPPHKIRLMIFKDQSDWDNPKNNPNCDWKSITLRKDSKSLADAKAFINENIEAIMARYKIKQMD